jgi:multidrug efflux system membrane fusion protein
MAVFNRKNLIIVGVVIAALFISSRLFVAHAEGPPAMPPPPPITMAAVLEKDVTEWNEFSGRIEATDAVEVKPKVSGTIEKVHFQDGAMVKKGDVLFTIDPRPYKAEYDRLMGTLSAAESALTNAKQEIVRAKNLMETKAISKREYDERASALRIAEGNLKAARGGVDAVKLNLEYTDVVAPISGKVSRAEITEGNTVNAGSNAPVLTRIVALSPIYISFEVDEQTFLSHIQNYPPEMLKQIPVQVGLANQKDTPITAAIHSFDNQLDVSSGTIRVRAINDNADGRLVPGLFARVRLGTPKAETRLLINEKAIGTDQSKKYVFVVNDKNMAEYHEVTLGSEVDGLRVVQTGLKAGDKVIVNGLMRVRPGAPVSPELVDMQTGQKPDAAPAAPPAPAPEAEAKPEVKPGEPKKDDAVLIPAEKEPAKEPLKVEDVPANVDQPKK